MAAHGAYTALFENNSRCYYCGVPATCMDHFPPIVLYETGGEAWLIPSCTECNSILGSDFHYTLEQRKAHVKYQLEKRYKKVLAIPEWTDDELIDMEYALLQHIENSRLLREQVIDRLSY